MKIFKIFMDTANIDEIYLGVTTNPSLVAKEGIKGMEGYKSAVQEVAAIVAPSPWRRSVRMWKG